MGNLMEYSRKNGVPRPFDGLYYVICGVVVVVSCVVVFTVFLSMFLFVFHHECFV